MSGPTLSRFTPSLLSHDLLERLFVARDRILEEVMRRVETAATSTERHHTLLVGPRGAGKTHAVSLVYHRTKALIDDGAKLQVAWLPEDPWTIVTYRHLLTEIARRLEPSIKGDLPRSAEELEGLLHARASAAGPIVVIAENLDVILKAIEDDGQQRLRHLLQSDRSLVLVATTTTLDRALSDQSSPFYGFFTTTRLEPFDVREAAAMLTAISVERGDDELVAYLASDEGQARLRTIEHLAGGQPRMWAALASALTVQGLDDLVDLLLTRVDDLTPYYQEQLARLSGHQRLVVSELAEADRPMTIKELAERLEIDQRSLGKTMSELVDKRWIAETTSPVTQMLDRRRTYYELAEPMARISFQIKDNRGEPLRVVVDFLKHWFDPADLTGDRLVDDAEEIAGLVERHLKAALAAHRGDPVMAATRRLSGLPESGGPAGAILAEVDDALHALDGGIAEPFLALPAPIRLALEVRLEDESLVDARVRVHEAALNELDVALTAAAAPWVGRATTLVTTAGATSARAQSALVAWLALAGRHREARAAISAMPQPSSVMDRMYIAHSAITLANAFTETGDCLDAIASIDKALDLVRDLPELTPDRAEGITESMQSMRANVAKLADAGASVDEPAAEAIAEALPRTASLCRILVRTMEQSGHLEEAKRLQQRIVDAVERELGDADPRTVAARESLEGMSD